MAANFWNFLWKTFFYFSVSILSIKNMYSNNRLKKKTCIKLFKWKLSIENKI